MAKTKLNQSFEAADAPSTATSSSASTSKSPYDIYDRMFKRIEHLSNKAVIAFINGVFNKDYPPDSTITYNNAEFIDHELNKVVADKIMTINGTDSFHMEATMYDDDEIVVRFMEYGFQHAITSLSQLRLTDKHSPCIITYPEQLLIYLDTDPTAKIPDKYPLFIRFPGAEEIPYSIPVLKFQEKEMDEIREKHMIILLPFRLLRLRKLVEREYNKGHSKEAIHQLIQLYQNDIIEPIDRGLEQGYLTWTDRIYLLALARRLARHLYDKYDEIREGINKMANPYLELDVDEYMEKYEALEAERDSIANERDSIANERDSLAKEAAEKDQQLEALQKRVKELEALLSKK